MKAAQFIQLCNQSRTPLIYLQNITGFMVGRKYEEEGIIKHGAKMINAVANSTVPQFTVIVGGSLWRGQLRHVRAHVRPDAALHLAQQPHRRDGRGAGGRGAGHRAGGRGARARPASRTAAQIEMMRAMVTQKFEEEASPYYATARLWDDGILDPRETRMALTVGLSMSYNRDWVQPGSAALRRLPDVTRARPHQGVG